MKIAHWTNVAAMMGGLGLLLAGCGDAQETTGTANYAASAETCNGDCVQACAEQEDDSSVCVGLCSAACTQLLVKAEEQVQCDGADADCGELKAQRKSQVQVKAENQVLTCTAKCLQTRDETQEQVAEELCGENGECTQEQIAEQLQDRLNECAVGCMAQSSAEGEGGNELGDGSGEASGDGSGEAAGDQTGAGGESSADGSGQQAGGK